MDEGTPLEEKRTRLYQEMEADPSDSAAPYQLFRLLQNERRMEDGSIPPGDEEIHMICRAWKLAPNHPRVILSFCVCLAESLGKYSPNDSDMKIMKFGRTKRFSGVQHAYRYLDNQAHKVLDLCPTSLELNLKIANIFYYTLPYWCRDNRFAKLCLQRALLFHSQSSKANLSMGLFALSVEQSVKEAQVCFEVAYHLNPDDFLAVVNLLLCSMNEYKEKVLIAQSVFKRELGSEERTDTQNAGVYFIRGLYGVITGDLKSTAKSWMKARDYDEEQLIFLFEKLNKLKKKFRWPSKYDEMLSYLNIVNFLKPLLEKVPARLLPNLKAVRTIIKNAGRKEVKDSKAAAASSSTENPSNRFDFVGSGAIDHDDEHPHEDTRVPTKRTQAYQHLNIPDESPKTVVENAYADICLRYRADIPDLSEDEIRNHLRKMRKINWAYSVLMQ